MDKKIDLTEILENCPKGTKLYSTVQGEVTFDHVDDNNKDYPIVINCIHGLIGYAYDGSFDIDCNGECVLFPSKDQRDWSKFTAPWYKKDKFNPRTLKPFDKVLVKTYPNMKWRCDLFSAMLDPNDWIFPYIGFNGKYKRCIPLNDETKRLVGTTEEAPEYYRYWED